MVEFRYLRPNEKPPDHAPWLIIVKTHGLDFELVATVSRYFRPVTLGTDATLDAALDRAIQAAEKFGTRIVYVTGVTAEASCFTGAPRPGTSEPGAA